MDRAEETDWQKEQFRKALQRAALLSIPMIAFLGHSLAFRVDMPRPGKHMDIPVLTFGLAYCTFMASHYNRWRPFSRKSALLLTVITCLMALGMMCLRLNWTYDGWVIHD